MARVTLICIIGEIRNIFTKISNLSSKSQQQQYAKASIGLALSLAKEFNCEEDCSTSKFIDTLEVAEKKLKSIRSKGDAEAISDIISDIESLKAVSLKANFEHPEDSEAEVEVEEAEVEAEVESKPMTRDEVLKESHKLAKKIRAEQPDMTYSQALKIATTKLYALCPKSEKKHTPKAKSNQDGKDALLKAHAIAKQLRASNPEMTYRQALKAACNQVYGH